MIEEISPGVGGMGVVYKAREVSLDRIVAVKVAKSRLKTLEGRAFFEREAQSAARLDHPNILKIFRFAPEQEPPFYVMQFLEGRRLDQACRGHDAWFVARLLEKVARALSYAHARGVIHRDIKPSNILVDAANEPYVADFGLAARIADPSSSDASLLGTPQFIAPEVYEQVSRVGPEIDIYALGVTMYELLTGRLPFADKDLREIRRAVIDAGFPLPQELNAAIPEPLQRICLKAMEKDPASRYDSADAMADDLRRFLDDREVLARPTRYEAQLRGRLQSHLAEIRLWREQSLIDVGEMDRLARPYHALLDSVSPWRQLARRFPWESITLRVGGWLVLISSVLWPVFYWQRLTRAQRVWAVGLPTLVINLVGWLLRSRGSRVNGLIYLSTGALLWPLFVSIVLAEYHVWPHAQDPVREVFGNRTQGVATESREAYAPTNLQITLCAAVFTGYCLLLLLTTRAAILALWLGIGMYLVYCGLLLMTGLKQWVLDDHVARALLLFLAFSLVFWPLAAVLERRAAWAARAPVFFTLFPIPFVVTLNLLARYGAVEWFGAEARWDDQTINLFWMFDGAVFLLVAAWSIRARSSYARFWGGLLMLMVPLHLLSPTQILFGKPGHDLFRVGGAAVTSYEAASVIIALGLIALGVRMRQHALVLPALLGLAIFFFRTTDRHFRDYLSWPLGIALAGGAAMATALISLTVRARRGHEPVI